MDVLKVLNISFNKNMLHDLIYGKSPESTKILQSNYQ